MKKALLFAIALTGCDKLLHRDTDTSSATTTATATATAPAVATATTIVATTTATASAAPSSDWPAYLPDYPGAKVVKKTSDSDGKYELLETKDARDKVVAFYKEKLAAAGFPPGASASLGASAKDPNASTTITTSKGSVMITLTITPSNGLTKISISLPA